VTNPISHMLSWRSRRREERALADLVAAVDPARVWGPEVPNLALPLVASLLARSRLGAGSPDARAAARVQLEPKLQAFGLDKPTIDRLVRGR
jgi:hypothetical protein